MPVRVLEIVQINQDEYGLRTQKDSDDSTKVEPLIRIKFSLEALDFLSDASGEVAKTMIEAGLRKVESLMDEQHEEASDETLDELEPPPVIH